MKTKLRPMDVIMAHPDTLKNIKPRTPLDNALLEMTLWGFTFHPDEHHNTKHLDVAADAEIDWSVDEGFEDVEAYVVNATQPARFRVAGEAEHIISLRRLLNAQPEVIREGPAWSAGTACHLKNLLSQAE
jgi:hypothetical protein